MKTNKTHKVLMLPTKKESNIRLGKIYNTLHYKNNVFDKEFGVYQHLYIISDEEIKEGDWVINQGDYDEDLIFKADEGLFHTGLEVGNKGWNKLSQGYTLSNVLMVCEVVIY